MWNALAFDWWKCDAARAMKQRAIFRRPCLSQQLAVCGLYFVHRWLAHGPRELAVAVGAVAATSSTMNAVTSAARRIADDHLRRVGNGQRRLPSEGRSPAGEGRRGWPGPPVTSGTQAIPAAGWLRAPALHGDVVRRVAVWVHDDHRREAGVGHAERAVADARVAAPVDRDLRRGVRSRRVRVGAAVERGADRGDGARRAVAWRVRDHEPADLELEPAAALQLYGAALQGPRSAAGRYAVERRVGRDRWRERLGEDGRVVMPAVMASAAVVAEGAGREGHRHRRDQGGGYGQE